LKFLISLTTWVIILAIPGILFAEDKIFVYKDWTVNNLGWGVQYSTNGAKNHDHEFGFIIMNSSCEQDLFSISWSASYTTSGVIEEAVRNGGTVSLNVDDKTYSLKMSSGFSYPIVDRNGTFSFIFKGAAASDELIALLKKGKEISVSIDSPSVLLNILDNTLYTLFNSPSDTFSLEGYVATRLKSQEFCSEISRDKVSLDNYESGLQSSILGDFKKAHQIWMIEAQKGDPNAQYQIGIMYQNGIGVTQDFNESMKWYRAAMEQGHAKAKDSFQSSYPTISKSMTGHITDFIEALKKNDIIKIAGFIKYPLQREIPIPPILNEHQFVERFNEVFDDYLIQEIVETDIEKDLRNWRLFSSLEVSFGDLLMDLNGKVIGVNYQSEIEIDLQKEYLVTDFIESFKNNNIVKIADFIKYPLWREPPITPILNDQQFIDRFEEVFDDYMLGEIVKSDIENDWSVMGYKGIMLRSGDLWLDFEGKVISVNYQSLTEKGLKQKYINAFERPINKDIDYGVRNMKFVTSEGDIPDGCFGQLMTELNGDDTVAAIFLNRTLLRGCIDANDTFPGGVEDDVTYEIVEDLGGDIWNLRICHVVDGSIRQTCSMVTVKFTNRIYTYKSKELNVLSLEKLGEWEN
jgi:hypothetical protein